MRKVDFQKTTLDFKTQVQALKVFLSASRESFAGKDTYISNCYEYGIINLYKFFEIFLYRTIIGCINHNSSSVNEHYKLNFGKHVSDEICDFILTKGGYFDFKGRNGLIKICKQHIGDTYGIVDILKKPDYKDALDSLIALRNYAAHTSRQAKLTVKKTLNVDRITTVGSYLKKQNRLEIIADKLCKFADEIAIATR